MIKNIIVIISVIIILILIAVYCGKYFFNEYFKTKAIKLLSISKDISNEKFNLDKLDNLPEPVKRYFQYSLGDCSYFISSVKMKHEGKFKNPSGKWVDIESYYNKYYGGF